MDIIRLVLLAPIAIALASVANGQQRGDDPFVAYECAAKAGNERTRVIQQYVQAAVSRSPQPELGAACAQSLVARKGLRGGSGNWFLLIAELMKRVGDYRAPAYYQDAIDADANEAGYHFFYGEYLRNFRGPQEPLFPQAERQYLLAQQVLARVKGRLSAAWDPLIESRLARSLVALHQRDGLPLALRSGGNPDLFLASVFRFAESNADLDRTSDVRDYTSAAAFAQSAARQGSPLTRDQLRSLIRIERPLDTFDRLRFRHDTMPVIDLIYDFRHTSNVAPEVYEPPFVFVPLQLNTWGISMEKPFTVAQAVDVSIQGSFQQTWRQGLIEYVPEGIEHINQFQGSTVLSRYIGRDKLNVSMVYVYQAIDPEVAGEANRERRMLAPTISYQFFRPYTFSEHFQTRGIEVFGGTLLDRETYPEPRGINEPDTLVWRKDYFGGIAARGLAGGRWDVTFQPTFFSSAVRPDHTQDNSQYRTNVVVLYRIVDEEKMPALPGNRHGTHLAFLHLVFPLRDDVPRQGIGAYRNYKAGVELDSMWYNTTRSGISFLGSIRYDFQRFYALNKDQNLFTAGISVGF
jgi:hypothetical protein